MSEAPSIVAERQSEAGRNRAVIEKLYAAANAGESSAIPELFGSDCEMVQADGHPVPGTWKGREAVLQGMGELFTRLGVKGMTVHEVIADGPERVIALIDVNGVDTSGQPYTMPVAEAFLVRDGTIAEVRPFYWDVLRLSRLVGSERP